MKIGSLNRQIENWKKLAELASQPARNPPQRAQARVREIDQSRIIPNDLATYGGIVGQNARRLEFVGDFVLVSGTHEFLVSDFVYTTYTRDLKSAFGETHTRVLDAPATIEVTMINSGYDFWAPFLNRTSVDFTLYEQCAGVRLARLSCSAIMNDYQVTPSVSARVKFSIQNMVIR